MISSVVVCCRIVIECLCEWAHAPVIGLKLCDANGLGRLLIEVSDRFVCAWCA